MEKQIVSVLFLDEQRGIYTGRAYSYIDPTGELKAGEKVIVPAGMENERKKAMVVDTEIPFDSIPVEVRPKLKNVIGRRKA